MTWGEFEKFCVQLVKDSLDEKKYRIAEQHPYENTRCDIHIAEKRQGGKSFVIDCKHFTKADLTTHEIDTTLKYKWNKRASLAIIFASDKRPCQIFS